MASVHEGLRPFGCDICGQSFSGKTVLNRHVSAIHEGSKPFECNFCGKSFGRKGTLEGHVSRLHEKVPPPLENPIAQIDSVLIKEEFDPLDQ